jgi:glycosyltransferase involved in cell wall biosynthesis
MTVTPPRRVLITTSTFPEDERDAATARFILDLAQHLAAHVQVVVLAPGSPRAPTRSVWGRVTVLRYRYFLPKRLQRVTGGEGMLAAARGGLLPRVQLPFFLAAQWAALPRVVRDEGIDLVNAHWIVPQGVTAAAWRRRIGVPLVVSAHGADVALLARMPAGAALARYVFDRSDFFIADSRYLADETERIVGRPIPHEAIPMGVATSTFRPDGDALELRRQPSERVVLFVGKLVPKKGLPVLLDAVARVRATGKRVRLVIVGGGPLEAEVRARIGELGLEAAVELAGWVRNDRLPAYLRAADVVCVPSIRDEHGETEGTPVVLQEALAAGCLVVASDTSGIPDVVRHGVNGWLAPPGDAAALASALARALEVEGDARATMSQAARATSHDHRWERVAIRHLDCYAEALGIASAREVLV